MLLSHIYAQPEHHRGAERYLRDLALQLSRAGHSVQILTTFPKAYDDVYIGDVHITALKRREKRPGRNGAFAHEVAFAKDSLRFVAGRKIDVWHATSIGDASAAVRLSTVRPIRTVFTDHGFPVRASREKRPDHKAFQKVTTQIHSYLCMSQPAADALWQDYQRIAAVIPPGVDTDTFTVGGRRTDRPSILYSGSLTETRKNLPLLLQSVAVLLSQHPDLEVWLCGEGDVSSLLREQSEEVRRAVTHVGPLETALLSSRYQDAWVTVLPSDNEVFGMALTESLSCGTPGVGLDDGLGPSTILTKQTGVLAERSPEGLATAIEKALALSKRAATRKACRERGVHYDWQRSVVPRIIDTYRAERSHDHHGH